MTRTETVAGACVGELKLNQSRSPKGAVQRRSSMNRYASIVAASISLGLGTVTASAAPILVADYQFNVVSGATSLASSDGDLQSTAGPASLSGAFVTGTASPPPSSSSEETAWNTNAWSVSGAKIAEGKSYIYGLRPGLTNDASYVQFTVTPAALKELDYTSLTFSGRRSGSSVGTTTLTLRSSLDAYTGGLGSLGAAFNSDNNNNFINATIALNSVASLQNITTPVTFRLYVNASGTGTTSGFALDDIRLSAEVSTIPEPGSLALLAMGGLMMLPRRRKA